MCVRCVFECMYKGLLLMLLLLLHARQGHRFGAGCKYFIGRQDQGWKRETPGSLCRDGGMMEEREGMKGCGMQERKR